MGVRGSPSSEECFALTKCQHKFLHSSIYRVLTQLPSADRGEQQGRCYGEWRTEKKTNKNVYKMRGVSGAMADSVDLVPDPRERRMPMPATPAHSLTVGDGGEVGTAIVITSLLC